MTKENSLGLFSFLSQLLWISHVQCHFTRYQGCKDNTERFKNILATHWLHVTRYVFYSQKEIS